MRALYYLLAGGLLLSLGYFSGRMGQSQVSGWYAALQKPFGCPPGWVFGVVWSMLYVLLAILLVELLRRKQRQALAYFIVNMLLNFSFTPVFFGLQNMAGGCVIVALMLVSLWLCWHKLQLRKWLAPIFVVYAAWLCYAFYLSLGYLLLNLP